MPVRELRGSPNLAFERFADFDEFRPNDVMGGGQSFPFDPRNFSLSRAAVALPMGRLVMQRSFARRLESNMGAPGASLVIPLSPDTCAEINGRPINSSSIALFRGTTPTRAIEPHANTCVMLRFHSGMRDRGWPDVEGNFDLPAVTAEKAGRVQAVLFNIAAQAAASMSPREFSDRCDAMQNSLMEALDEALVVPGFVRPRFGSYESHRRLVSRLDDVCRQFPAAPLYSEDLARGVGVSVRTLQTSVQAVHGVSLHHYLRLKRLWAVRCQLGTGVPGVTIKAVALANGFWHMGELSKLYRGTFGELPSETLRRGAFP